MLSFSSPRVIFFLFSLTKPDLRRLIRHWIPDPGGRDASLEDARVPPLWVRRIQSAPVRLSCRLLSVLFSDLHLSHVVA